MSDPIKREELVRGVSVKEEAGNLNESATTESAPNRSRAEANGKLQVKKEKDETPSEASSKRPALIDYSSNESGLEMSVDQSEGGRSSPKIAQEHPTNEGAATNKSIVNIYSSEDESNDKQPSGAANCEVIRVSTGSEPPVEKVEIKKPVSESPGNDYEFEIELHDQSDHESMFSKHSISSAASTRKSASYAESISSSRGSSSDRSSGASSSSGSESSGAESSDQESGMLTDDDDKSQKSARASVRSAEKESKRVEPKRELTPRSSRASTPASARESSRASSRRSRRKSRKAIKSERKRSPRRRSRRSRESRRSVSDNSTKRLKTGDHSHRSRRERRSRSAEPSDSKRFSFDSNAQIKQFTDLKISTPFLRKLDEMNVREPNDLQKLILPALLDCRVDRNILVQSKPLSGKKLLFLIPALERIDSNLEQPQVFILAPTAELCAHFYELAEALCEHTRIRISFLVCDFDSKRKKITDHLVISTMGTLLACLRKHHVLDPSCVRLMIYYGIDCLAASAEDLRRIRDVEDQLSSQCQRLFSSDSFGYGVSRFVRKSINFNLITFNEFYRDELTGNILQFYVRCRMRNRFRVLFKLLKNTRFERLVIYAFGPNGVSETAKVLERTGYNVITLNNRAYVDERMNMIDKFRRSSRAVLVLNYPLTNSIDLGVDLSMVINFDVRLDRSDFVEYIHRISKVGRGPQPGFVVNVVCLRESRVIKKLEKHFNIRMIELIVKI